MSLSSKCTKMQDEQKIAKIALYSRIFLIILQYASNQIIPDHDAGVFLYPKPKIVGYYDSIVDHFLGGFERWDAQYFIHIALYGYTYENTVAFFPVYPLMLRHISFLLNALVPILSLDSAILFVAVLLNVIIFKYAAVTLYRLTRFVLNQNVAFTSTVLFCLNPASIFFSAPYSECIFSYLTFQSMLNCILIYKYCSKLKISHLIGFRNILFAFPIALSTIVRSNGVLNVGFLLYTFLCIYFDKLSFCKNVVSKAILSLKFLFIMTFYTFICLVPFILYQYYCYQMFCSNFDYQVPKVVADYAKNKKLILPGQFELHNQTWCYYKIPLAYSYVQDHYWNVGFLKYYDLKQIPNFCLALPILLVIVLNSAKYLCTNLRLNIKSVFTFDMLKKAKDNQTIEIFVPQIFIFVCHALFLSLFCIFFIHIQVSTRILCSASPVFYWFCAKYLHSLKLTDSHSSVLELGLKTYYLSYFLAGTLLFSNFLPWT